MIGKDRKGKERTGKEKKGNTAKLSKEKQKRMPLLVDGDLG